MKTACKKMITQQVSEILRIEIEDGDLYPGTKIPTDTELAEIRENFNVQIDQISKIIPKNVRASNVKSII